MSQAARQLAVDTRTLRKALASRGVPVYKLGRAVRIPTGALDQLLTTAQLSEPDDATGAS